MADDAELLRRAREGDTRALSALYGQYCRVVFARAFLETGSRADAEELMQDEFLLLWKKRRMPPIWRSAVRSIFGWQAVPDVELNRRSPLHLSGSEQFDQLLMQLNGQVPVSTEAQPLRSTHHGLELLEHGLERMISQRCDRDPVEFFVAVQCRANIARGNRLGEAAIRVPHTVHVRFAEPARHLAHGQFVHCGDDVASIAHRSRVDGADRR